MYITREDMLEVIARMQDLESKLGRLFSNHNYNLRENLGRRNQLLSAVQEKETGSKSGGSISFALQTDYATLKKKESLDYLFMLANDDFDKFCIIFFEGLTIDDYFPPASGSRGKSRMRKQTAIEKATFLVGGVKNLADDHVVNINKEIEERKAELANRKTSLYNKLKNTSLKAVAARKQIETVIENETVRCENAIEKLVLRREYWCDNPKFSFQFESVKQQPVIKKKTQSRTRSFKDWWINKLTASLG